MKVLIIGCASVGSALALHAAIDTIEHTIRGPDEIQQEPEKNDLINLGLDLRIDYREEAILTHDTAIFIEEKRLPVPTTNTVNNHETKCQHLEIWARSASGSV